MRVGSTEGMAARERSLYRKAIEKGKRLQLGEGLLIDNIMEAHKAKILYHQLAYSHLRHMPSRLTPLLVEYAQRADLTIDLMREAPVFRVDAAASQVSTKFLAKDSVKLDELPSMVPPFEMTWMEFKDPMDITVDKTGVFIMRTSAEYLLRRSKSWAQGMMHGSGYERIAELGGWLVSMYPFYYSTSLRMIQGGMAEMALALDGEGCIIPELNYRIGVSPLILESERMAGGTVDDLHGEYANTVAIVSTALALLGCNNVLTPETVPSRGVQRMRQSVGRLPVSSFKTLVIDPARTPRRYEGRAESGGAGVRRHTVRGEFRRYGPKYGRGNYFGREGNYIFYVPEHERGDASLGVVQRDYELKG